MTRDTSKNIILFDGVCNLCNTAIQFIIERDPEQQFVFAALESNFGKEFLKKRGINTLTTDSIILYIPNKAYYLKSDAALKIASKLKSQWKVIKVFTIVPRGIRDIVYDFIARNRYAWYGKKDQCMLPTPELKARFLD